MNRIREAVARKAPLAVLLLLFVIFVLCGCSKTVENTPEVLTVKSGATQYAMPGAECSDILNVEVLGGIRRGLFGGKGKRLPTVGVKLRVVSMTPGASADPETGITDAGGNFHCRLMLARKFGDQYFKVICPDFEEVRPVYVHAIAGVQIIGDSQETVAGEKLPDPIQVKVFDETGKPAAGMPVFFSMKSGPVGAKLSAYVVNTDNDGFAGVSLKTVNGYTGKYEVLAEVGDGPERTRGIVIKAMALGRLNLLIGVLGGLGIFIFGMTMMSDGLQQIAGDKLKSLLQLFTGNRYKAMLAGLVVTALIQSSSACTVMVVGFVNAALINLTQAIGIILGAAIGTTVTAQMVSLNLDFLALPAIAVGVLFSLIAKKSQTRGIANTILGFGLLFFGMTIMSSQLKSIAEFPTFISFFRKFDCTPAVGSAAPPIMSVLGAIAVGTVMTMIVQSSSATVGLAIALADSGLLNFYTAVPLILGDNIGTTITGLLAALNTNRSSRQAAVAATVFKVLGVIIMLIFFYVPWGGVPCFLHLVDLITAGDVFDTVPENIGRHLAAAHTMFNVLNVLIFLPFVNVVAAIARLVVPDKGKSHEDDNIICHLEQRLLNTPSAALSQVLTALIAMTDAAMDLTRKSVTAFVNPDKAIADSEVNRLEGRIDATQHSIIDYLVMLTRRHLNVSQSNIIPVFMHCVNDIERIGDRAVNIFDLLPTLQLKGMTFSDSAIGEIREIDIQLNKMVETLLAGLRCNDLAAIQKVVIMDAEVKRMTARFERSHEARLKAQDCTVEKGVVFVELLANLERISAHLTNVAERAKDMLPHSVSFQKLTTAANA